MANWLGVEAQICEVVAVALAKNKNKCLWEQSVEAPVASLTQLPRHTTRQAIPLGKKKITITRAVSTALVQVVALQLLSVHSLLSNHQARSKVALSLDRTLSTLWAPLNVKLRQLKLIRSLHSSRPHTVSLKSSAQQIKAW